MTQQKPEAQPGKSCSATIDGGLVSGVIHSRRGDSVVIKDDGTGNKYEVNVSKIRLH